MKNLISKPSSYDNIQSLRSFLKTKYQNYFVEDTLDKEELGLILFIIKFYVPFKEIILNSSNELEKEIYTIRNLFDKNIEVLDFFSFWRRIVH